MQEQLYNATIKWVDTGDIQDVTMKIGDISDNDDDIFFYLESESEIESFKKEGVHDWIILEINKA